jgi:hypothetical protein
MKPLYCLKTEGTKHPVMQHNIPGKKKRKKQYMMNLTLEYSAILDERLTETIWTTICKNCRNVCSQFAGTDPKST